MYTIIILSSAASQLKHVQQIFCGFTNISILHQLLRLKLGSL